MKIRIIYPLPPPSSFCVNEYFKKEMGIYWCLFLPIFKIFIFHPFLCLFLCTPRHVSIGRAWAVCATTSPSIFPSRAYTLPAQNATLCSTPTTFAPFSQTRGLGQVRGLHAAESPCHWPGHTLTPCTWLWVSWAHYMRLFKTCLLWLWFLPSTFWANMRTFVANLAAAIL